MQIIQERNPWEPFAQGFSQGLQNLAQGITKGQERKQADRYIYDASHGEGSYDALSTKPKNRESDLLTSIKQLAQRSSENILNRPSFQFDQLLSQGRTPSPMDFSRMQSGYPLQGQFTQMQPPFAAQDLLNQRLPQQIQQAAQNPNLQKIIATQEQPVPFQPAPITPDFLRGQADKLERLNKDKYGTKVADLRHRADRLEDKMERAQKAGAPKKMTVAVFQKIWEMANEDPEKAKKLAESLGYEIPKNLSDISEEE